MSKCIIEKFNSLGGAHCITTALRQIFEYHHYPISEAMLFGLGSGLAFIYINLAASPMISGRNKVFEFEGNLAECLGISIKCHKEKEYSRSFEKAKGMIDRGEPVLIYVDMPYLSYLNLNKNSHFGGHAVVLFGYDDEQQVFYVSDRDAKNYSIRTPKGNIAEDYHLVPYNEVEAARSSNYRPFPANNKYLEIDFNHYEGKKMIITSQMIKTAIKKVCDTMLDTSIHMMGISGIKKFQKEVMKWSRFSEERLKLAGITNYFLINKDGGTGGGLFRKLYGEFLIEADLLCQGMALKTIGEDFIKISHQWDYIAEKMWQLGESGQADLLGEVCNAIEAIYIEENRLYTSLKTVVNF